MKKKALISSILTIALCLSLIAGSTFALFTSESKVNVAVTSGTVDVVATVEDLVLGTTLAKGNLSETSATQDAEDSNIITLDKIIPGDYVTFKIRIHNNSDVAVQYRTVITKVADEGLWNGLVVTFDDVKYEGTNTVKTEWNDMAVGCDDIIVSVKVAFPEEAGNEYQHTSCKFAYTVEAVQGNAEITQEWDGQTTTSVSKNTEDGKYHINTAAELMWMMEQSQNTALSSIYSGESIVLENNIDLGGATITGFGNANVIFAGSFDGKNHTISNFKIDNAPETLNTTYYAGLFNYYSHGTLENLTVKNASVNGDQMVGALIGNIDNGATVKNCSVEDCTVIGYRKVGGAIGYGANATATGISVKNTNVYCGVTEQSHEQDQWGKVIGYVGTGLNVNGYDEKVNIVTGAATVSTAAELTSAVAANTANVSIVLTSDIVAPADWTPIDIGFYGDYRNVTNLTIVGNGHTISGLNSALVEKISGNCSLTISDLTVKGASISNSSYTNGMGNGILVGYVENGNVTLDNCHVVDSSLTESSVAAAALIGYISNGTEIKITNCSIKNTNVIGDSAAGFVGYVQKANVTVSGCKVSESTFTGEKTEKQGAYFGTVNVDAVANISNTTADTTTTALVGRILSTGAVNYN